MYNSYNAGYKNYGNLLATCSPLTPAASDGRLFFPAGWQYPPAPVTLNNVVGVVSPYPIRSPPETEKIRYPPIVFPSVQPPQQLFEGYQSDPPGDNSSSSSQVGTITYDNEDPPGDTPIPSGKCSIGGKPGACGASKSPTGLDILDPRFNLREVAKHIILLEDHLSHSDKRCNDCISKHFLTIEAFLEEAITLDKDGQFRAQIAEILRGIRDLMREFSAGIKNDWDADLLYFGVSQKLRVIRKPLCVEYCYKV